MVVVVARPPLSSSRPLVPSSSCHSAAPRFHPASSCSQAWFGVPVVVVSSSSSPRGRPPVVVLPSLLFFRRCCSSVVVVLPSLLFSHRRCRPVVAVVPLSPLSRCHRSPIVVVVPLLLLSRCCCCPVVVVSSSSSSLPSSLSFPSCRRSPVSTPRAVARGRGSGCRWWWWSRRRPVFLPLLPAARGGSWVL